jgi:hypothetical protein
MMEIKVDKNHRGNRAEPVEDTCLLALLPIGITTDNALAMHGGYRLNGRRARDCAALVAAFASVADYHAKRSRPKRATLSSRLQ